MKRVPAILLVLFCASCADPATEKFEQAGTFVDAQEVATSWNESQRSRVVTTTGTYCVATTQPSAKTGEPVFVSTHFLKIGANGYPRQLCGRGLEAEP